MKSISWSALCLGLAAALICAHGCQSKKVYGGGGAEGHVARRPIEAVLKDHTEELMALPGIVGTAQGLCAGKPCIKVFVSKRTPTLDSKIPGELEGYPVEVDETGEIKAAPGK